MSPLNRNYINLGEIEMNIAHYDTAVAYHCFDKNYLPSSAHQLLQLVHACHESLLNCPKVKEYLNHCWGIDLAEIRQYRIGYFDTELSIFNSGNQSQEKTYYTDYESLKGCITIPLFINDDLLGIHGTLHTKHNRHADIKHLLEPNVIWEPMCFSKSVLRCVNPLDVISLQKHGYQNAYCDMSGSLSELTLDRLHHMGVEVIVYFTDAYGADFDIAHARELAKYYRVRLCEVKLPFSLTNFGQWDMYQWQLFDQRLSSSLRLSGAYNERYQA